MTTDTIKVWPQIDETDTGRALLEFRKGARTCTRHATFAVGVREVLKMFSKLSNSDLAIVSISLGDEEKKQIKKSRENMGS